LASISSISGPMPAAEAKLAGDLASLFGQGPQQLAFTFFRLGDDELGRSLDQIAAQCACDRVLARRVIAIRLVVGRRCIR
jgi:hypothetical protein